MKKSSLKPLIISTLSVLAFTGVGVGTTFALFTDKAETSIEIKAGTIDIDSAIVITAVASLNSTDTGNSVAEDGLSAALTNGGTALVTTDTDGSQSLTISKFTPGDSVTFKVSVKNKSNVSTKWRVRLVRDNSALAAYLTDNFAAGASEWHTAAAAVDTTAGDTLIEQSVTISFPNHDNEITDNEHGVDNGYQDSSATFKVFAEAVQGNANVN